MRSGDRAASGGCRAGGRRRIVGPLREQPLGSPTNDRLKLLLALVAAGHFNTGFFVQHANRQHDGGKDEQNRGLDPNVQLRNQDDSGRNVRQDRDRVARVLLEPTPRPGRRFDQKLLSFVAYLACHDVFVPIMGTLLSGGLVAFAPCALQVDQRALAMQTPAISAQIAVSADDPVTWNRERDVVLSASLRDGACRAGPAEGGGDFAVRLEIAIGNSLQVFPYAQLECGRANIE